MVKKFLQLMTSAPRLAPAEPRTAMARFANAGADPLRERTVLESWAALSIGSRAAPRRFHVTYESGGLKGDTEMIGRDLHAALAQHILQTKEKI